MKTRMPEAKSDNIQVANKIAPRGEESALRQDPVKENVNMSFVILRRVIAN